MRFVHERLVAACNRCGVRLVLSLVGNTDELGDVKAAATIQGGSRRWIRTPLPPVALPSSRRTGEGAVGARGSKRAGSQAGSHKTINLF